MTTAQKNELIASYAKTYVRESDRGNNFGANNAKFQCCVAFNLCEKSKFDRIVNKLRKEEKDSQYLESLAVEQYRFATDSEHGFLHARSFGEAKAMLCQLVPDETLRHGATGWVEDAGGNRYERKYHGRANA